MPDRLRITEETRRIIARQVLLTRAGMLAERLANSFWPLATLLMVAYAAFAFRAFAGMSASLYNVVLALLAFGAVGLALWGAAGLRLPRAREAVTRLDATLPGRPISALHDDLAIGAEDPAARAVWLAHHARVERQAVAARAPAPDLAVSRKDRFGLRIVGLIAVVMAVLFARTPLPEAGVTPAGPRGEVSAGPGFEGWVTPPRYTGLPTLRLLDLVETRGGIEVPEGSGLILRAYGASAPGFEQGVSAEAVALVERAEGIRDASFSVDRSGDVILSPTGSAPVSWHFDTVSDTPPRLTEVSLSRALGGDAEIGYAGSDDHGVRRARAEITLDLAAVDRGHGLTPVPVTREPQVIELPVPLDADADTVTQTLVDDLSRHPYASLPVTMSVTLTDAAGQDSAPMTVATVLPRRAFYAPVARAVIEMRRDLLWSPANAARVAQVLRAVIWQPERLELPAGAYLSLRTVISRIEAARAGGLHETEVDALAADLWDVALLVEEGSLSDAERRLRQAQDRLSEALENGASDAEIAELMEELRDATDAYLDQRAREFAQDPEARDQARNQQPQRGESMDQGDLQDMLDRIQQLSEAGERDAAQALLDQLARMMENMQVTEGGPGQQGEGDRTQQGLQDTLREQQDLADQAFREMQRAFRERMGQDQPGQQGQPGEGQAPGEGDPQSGGEGLGGLAERQEALREMLDGLRGALPDATGEAGETGREALDDAERGMADARDALEQEDGAAALDRQAEAMENLREAMRQLDQEARQAQTDNGQSDGQGQARADAEGDRDPLGRPMGAQGTIDGTGTDLPGADALGRSRELLDELRRRAGERTRPEDELRYYQRLLDRF